MNKEFNINCSRNKYFFLSQKSFLIHTLNIGNSKNSILISCAALFKASEFLVVYSVSLF